MNKNFISSESAFRSIISLLKQYGFKRHREYVYKKEELIAHIGKAQSYYETNWSCSISGLENDIVTNNLDQLEECLKSINRDCIIDSILS